MGPFLVLGYRIGKYAVEHLAPRDEFDLLTEVFIPLKTPYSCILDGIQCSTKCTLGKWNIKWHESELYRIIVSNRRNNTRIVFDIKKEIIKEAEKCKDIIAMISKLNSLQIEEIALIRKF